MQTFIIKPYYGHDCNSVDGFNDGYYLDEVEVQAIDEDAAIEQCIAKQKVALPKDTEYLDFDENSVTWITDYCDAVTEDDNSDDDDDHREYLYKYIDFGDVKLKE